MFIGPSGSRSPLHIDSFASHFWMALYEGRKRCANARLVVPLYSVVPCHAVMCGCAVTCRCTMIRASVPHHCYVARWLFFSPKDTPALQPRFGTTTPALEPTFDIDDGTVTIDELKERIWGPLGVGTAASLTKVWTRLPVVDITHTTPSPARPHPTDMRRRGMPD